MKNSHFNLSNLEKAIDVALDSAENISKSWDLGDLEEKRRIQKLVFPDGILYNHRKHIYRTDRVNTILSPIPLVQSDLEQNKNGKNPIPLDFSRYVPETGLELLRA